MVRPLTWGDTVGMDHTSTEIVSAHRLRVLVINGGNRASVAFIAWLRDEVICEVQGPALTTDAAITLAVEFKPHVVLLDFEGLPGSVNYTVALLKELAPAPRVFVLTHDASEAMRRRAREAGVAQVFDKTTQLEELVTALATIGHAPHAHAAV